SKKCTNKNPPKNFIIFLGGLDKKKSYLNDIGRNPSFFCYNIFSGGKGGIAKVLFFLICMEENHKYIIQ
ncbi:hypothetical protein, partial [Clostridium neonatale]|uniref:hypothetical protein n=1 Tax=Clostridium neonatale TaxID=137838 RepID=UPI00397A128F